MAVEFRNDKVYILPPTPTPTSINIRWSQQFEYDTGVLRALPEPLGPEAVCKTKECEHKAKYILSAIDKFIDPCEDFYHFACGRQICKGGTSELNPQNLEMLLNNRLIDEQLHFLRHQIKDITEELLMCSWPFLDRNWTTSCIKDNSTILNTNVLSNLLRVGMHPLFSVDVIPDFRNNSQSIIVLDQMKSPRFSMLSTDGIDGAFYNGVGSRSYLVLDERSIVGIISEMLKDNSQKSDITEYLHEMKDFESIFSQMFDDDDFISKFPNYTTIKRLEEEIKVEKFFLNTLRGFLTEEIEINEDTKVYANLKYFKELISLLKATKLRTVANYLGWMIVEEYGFEVLGIYKDFDSIDYGEIGKQRACIKSIKKMFGFALTPEYAKKYFPERLRNDVSKFWESCFTFTIVVVQ
ncbi:Neprilysin-1 [Nymphon striatum]|nr:Neprilysin-1 [Nymphon striatum]